jgi:hypothetical protein
MILVMCAGCHSVAPWRVEHPPVAPPAQLPELSLRLPWNGETFQVPPPATIPDSFKQSPTYTRWQQVGNVQKFTVPIARGRTMVIDAWCFVIVDGCRAPVAPYIKIFRADGTLELDQVNGSNLNPEQWTLYADDGRTKLLNVVNRTQSVPNPMIESVDFYKDGKPDHRFDLRVPGEVAFDWQLDEGGGFSKVIHRAPAKSSAP